eukprot:Gb_35186 [translate_table: standard]
MVHLHSEEEGLIVQASDSPNGCRTASFTVWDLKTKPVQIIMLLLLVSYVISFAISLITTPFLCGINTEEHALLHNPSLGTTQKTNSGRCASLIDEIGGGNGSSNGGGILCCDRSNMRTDVCLMRGDVRTCSNSSSIFLYSAHGNASTEEKIRPYTRKWETSIMNTVDEITLKTINPDTQQRNACEVNHSVPAVVFSTGGYTGNVYHEFNDGILPLYITSEHFNREVVLVILEYHNWWMMKYGEIVQQLTNYPVVDSSGDKRVHCFPEMIVGLKIHDELTVDPSLMKDGKSIRDFRAVLSEGYAPRLRAMEDDPPASSEGSPCSNGEELNETIGYSNGSRNQSFLRDMDSDKPRPKLVILSRCKSRVLLNQNEIVGLAEKIGFQVEILNPMPTTELVRTFRALNSCDVMLGVHGAAMTHLLFMRPGSVFIQIVPLGTDWAAATYYGEPAVKLGLKYIHYKILPEESSLFEKYERNDPVLRNPDSITSKGWSETKRVYLDGQDVRLSLTRLKKRLLRAYSHSNSPRNLMHS